MWLLLLYFIDLLVNIVGWAISSALETDHFYDLTGALSYVLLATVSWTWSKPSSRGNLATGMLMLWAVRLGVFLFTRVLATGRDARLTKYLKDPVKFLVLWFAQSLWVFFNSLPVLLLATYGEGDLPHGPVAVLALAGWVAGFSIEALADEQKRQFRMYPSNRSKFIASGLWAYSRHPNYFGQILLNISLAVYCASALSFWPAAAALLSPAFETWLLLRVSGVPLLEQAARRKWGDDPAYRKYEERTSVLIPWPPKPAPKRQL